jgi:hypothetical protein
MSDTPMMKCGHAANAHDQDGNPCCVICIGFPGAKEIDTSRDLSGRKARCAYYGKGSADGRYRATNESNYGDRAPGAICQCEELSSSSLPFFEHRPDADFDKFYCGCHGWD